MQVDMVTRGPITVIGKMGEGPAGLGATWIPALWEAANRDFLDIAHLAKRGADGSLAGLWGAMADENGAFLPWGKTGKTGRYLAGCEAVDGAEAPEGWTKWVIPRFCYVAVKCTQDTYGEAYSYMIGDYMKEHRYHLVGAVQEFYQPKEKGDSLYLCFPVERPE